MDVEKYGFKTQVQPDQMTNECNWNTDGYLEEDFCLPSALSHGFSSVLSSLT